MGYVYCVCSPSPLSHKMRGDFAAPVIADSVLSVLEGIHASTVVTAWATQWQWALLVLVMILMTMPFANCAVPHGTGT